MSTYRIKLIAALSAIALCAPPALSAQTSTATETQQQTPATSMTSATTTDAVKPATDDAEEASVARSKGQPVRSSDGNELGKIHDFIIDGSSGKIVQVVVSTGGVLGVGDQLRLVSASSVKESDNDFTADVAQAQFQSMPTITEDDFNAGRFPTTGEMKQGDSSSSGQLIAASELKGKSIRSDDWEVGEIEHVVLDLDSGKALALVDVNDAFAGEGGDYLVPFTKLQVRSGESDQIASTLLRSDFSSEQAASATGSATTGTSSTAGSSPAGASPGQTVASTSSPSAAATSTSSSGTSTAASTPSTSPASATDGQSGLSEPAQGVAATGTRSSDATKSEPSSTTASSSPGTSDSARSSTSTTAATGDIANSPSGVITNTPPPLPADENERLTPTGRSSAEQGPAAATTAVMAIRRALDTDPELARENVQVASKIVLEGSVQTDEAKRRVEELAKEAAGSLKIENQITVERK